MLEQRPTFAAPQRPRLAGLEPPEPQGSHPDAHQSTHGMAQHEQATADLALFAFDERETEGRRVTGRVVAQGRDPGGRGAPLLERDAALEALHGTCLDAPLHAHPVLALVAE